MTEIINADDTSLKNALKHQQQPLKDMQCNNNVKSHPSSLSPTAPHSPKSVPQSKLIISNMESVIRSVKKQHVVKKKKRKIVEPEISDISMILTNSLTFVSPNVSNSDDILTSTVANGHVKLSDKEKCSSPSSSSCSSKENQSTPTSSSGNSPSGGSDKNDKTTKAEKIIVTIENECMTPSSSTKSSAVTSTASTTKKRNVSSSKKSSKSTKIKSKAPSTTKTSKKAEITPQTTTSSINTSTPNSNSTATPKKNAFTVMMSARNKVIGSNSPGKLQINDLTPSQQSDDATEKVKRKILLEEWADRKGARKRKLNDTEIEEYVDRKMNKRAKRLKNLLSNSRKRTKNDSTLTVVESNDDSLEVDRNVKSKRRRIVKKLVDSSEDEDDCIKIVDDSNCSNTTSSNVILETKVPSTNKEIEKASQDFVHVLSSPVKKRDSLFGYFPKLKTPENESTAVKKTECVVMLTRTPTPIKEPSKKKRGRPKKLSIVSTDQSAPPIVVKRECTPPPTPIAPSTSETIEFVEEGRQRPKRECRNNHPGYLYDIEISPAKVAAKKSVKLAKRRLSGSPLRKSPAKNRKSPVKMIPKPFDRLAPIFMKSAPKPFVDPAIAKARQLFLMSGIPECMKLEIDKQRAYEDAFIEEIEFFPTISHVQQLELSTNDDADSMINFEFIHDNDDDDMDTFESIINGKFSCGGAITKIEKTQTESSDNSYPSYANPKQLIKELKKNDGKFLYNRCYKQLLTKFQNIKTISNQIDVDPLTCHLDDNLSIEFIPSPSSAKELNGGAGETMFIEQYKPSALDEILVNSQPANELKKFLLKWLDNNENRTRNYTTSDDDFTDSQSNSMSMYSKSIVLVGPSGCGKTNAVYAIANELKFKVLEINASNLRTGKKIFKKLHEATQSHQVKKSQNNNSQKFETDSEDMKLLLSSNGTTTTADNLDENHHRSALILIEDADIVFEQDIGFIDAIQQLITVSKRPVILIANQRNCLHLQRLMCQNLIEFSAANSLNISKWLSTLSIVEMCLIPIDECKRLYMYNNCDLRKTLLEMQFFIQSEVKLCNSSSINSSSNNNEEDKVFMPQNSIFDFYTNDQNVSENKIIPMPLDFTLIRQQTATLFHTESMESILEFYDDITSAERLHFFAEKNDNNMGKSMAHDITCETIKQHAKLNKTKRLNMEQLSPNCEKKSSFIDILAGSIGANTKRSICLDIEPCLRTICRTEKIRTQTERRSSRFYHYLRNMKVSGSIANSFNTNIFDEYSTVFENLDENLKKV